MTDATYNGYHLSTLAKLAKELGIPTEDAFAAFIWQLSNQISPATLAMEFMRAAGYKPFEGFPLKRS